MNLAGSIVPFVAALLWPIIASAQSASAPSAPSAQSAPSAPPIADQATIDAAIGRGSAYLARQQNSDGAFQPDGPRLATAALALMSFLAAGHTPDVGRYGLVVRDAADCLIRQAPDDGYFGKVDGSRMYGQGIITLALAEAYGVDPDPQKRQATRAVLERALKVILTAQAVHKSDVYAGGWRYEPRSGDSDLSLSGWNALAMRSCQNIGLSVPKESVGAAVAFVMRCYRPEQRGFAYMPGQDSTVPMTGVGLLNLYLLDAADQPHTSAAAAYLVDKPLSADTRFAYYGFYYATQAAFQAGGPTWDEIQKRTQPALIALQMPDGGWPQSKTPEESGRIYATAMSLLTLSVPYRLLPVYQR